MSTDWEIHNPDGMQRVIVTSQLPGKDWLELLKKAGFRVEVYQGSEVIGRNTLEKALEQECHGVLGQLTESWDGKLMDLYAQSGGKVYCNYAVGFDNVDVDSATRNGIAIGNTPGVLTETTAELAVALTFATARRIVEADAFMREGKFHGWRPNLFLGELLYGKTLGLIGAGRIGSSYTKMMSHGHHMNVLYYNRSGNKDLESEINAYGQFLEQQGDEPVECRRVESLDNLLVQSDVISLHVSLNEESKHLITQEYLGKMKRDAILVNTSRGQVIDEEALVAHCRKNPEFRVGLDVYEDEPEMEPGLSELPNVVLAPHLGSATGWTRENMARLAALNIIGVLRDYPLWNEQNIHPFLTDSPPKAIPSIVNSVLYQ